MIYINAIVSGLSPRVRGSRPSCSRRPRAGGSIPAGAGEPRCGATPNIGRRVYPRGCGGAYRSARSRPAGRGLSPRVRGSRATTATPQPRGGSIPAGAGEPPRGLCEPAAHGVYPRGCGGALPPALARSSSPGLSPRVRGSRPCDRSAGPRRGSIPAGAGEPVKHPVGEPKPEGLSPRVRGSPLMKPSRIDLAGSIPAGAGEPAGEDHPRRRRGVYPRGCGGAAVRPLVRGLAEGLSPRVRGSRDGCGLRPLWPGSIPAGAGEPAQGR